MKSNSFSIFNTLRSIGSYLDRLEQREAQSCFLSSFKSKEHFAVLWKEASSLHEFSHVISVLKKRVIALIPAYDNLQELLQQLTTCESLSQIDPKASFFPYLKEIISDLKEKEKNHHFITHLIQLMNEISFDVSFLDVLHSNPKKSTGYFITSLCHLLSNIKLPQVKNSIISTIIQIPPERRIGTLKLIEPLVKNIENGVQKKYIIEVVSRIEDRKEVVIPLYPLLESLNNGFKKGDIIRLVAALPPHDRHINDLKKLVFMIQNLEEENTHASCMELLHLLSKNKRFFEIINETDFLIHSKKIKLSPDVVKIVRLIPEKQRCVNAIEACSILIEDINQKHLVEHLIQSLKEIKEEDRLEIIDAALPFFHCKIDGYLKGHLMILIESLPHEQRSIFHIESLLKLFEGTQDESQHPIVHSFKKIPSEYKIPVLLHTNSFIQDIPSSRDRCAFLEKVSFYASELSQNPFKQLLPVLSLSTTPSFRIDLIDALYSLHDEKEAQQIILCLADIFKYTQSTLGLSYQIKGIIEDLHLLPHDERNDILRSCFPLLTSTHHHLGDIFKVMAEIPEDERDHIVQCCKNSLKTFTSGQFQSSILKALAQSSKNLRTNSYAQHLTTFFQDVTDTEELVILLNRFPQHQRAFLAEELSSLFQNNNDSFLKKYLLKTIFKLPQNKRLPEIIKTLFDVSKYAKSDEQKKEILDLFSIIPPQILEKAHNFFTKMSKDQDFFSCLFAHDPSMQQQVYGYVSQQLERFMTDEEIAKHFSFNIYQMAPYLSNHKDPKQDPLMRQALAVWIALDPESQEFPKNPYRLYRFLQEITESEAIYSIEIPLENFYLNFDKLRNYNRNYIFQIKEMPQKTFEDFVKNLRESAQKSPQIVKEIENQFPQKHPYFPEMTLNGHEIIDQAEHILLKGAIIPYYLDQERMEGRFPITTFYLFSILSMIERYHDECCEQTLSQQQKALLEFVDYIANSPTGQRDGIENYYFESIKKHQFYNYSNKDLIHTHLQNSLEKFLKEVICSKEFLKNFSKGHPVIQDHHQTLYLKNRLYKQLGFKHDLIFDLHTNNLYQDLIESTTPDLITKFSQHMRDLSLIAFIQNQVNDLFIEQPAVISSFVEIFKEINASPQNVWCTDKSLPELSEEGVITLMHYFGYFLVHDNVDVRS